MKWVLITAGRDQSRVEVCFCRCMQLSGRRLQNHGGIVHTKGLIPSPLPRWLQGLADRLHADIPLFGDKAPNHVLINSYHPGEGIMVGAYTCRAHTHGRTGFLAPAGQQQQHTGTSTLACCPYSSTSSPSGTEMKVPVSAPVLLLLLAATATAGKHAAAPSQPACPVLNSRCHQHLVVTFLSLIWCMEALA